MKNIKLTEEQLEQVILTLTEQREDDENRRQLAKPGKVNSTALVVYHAQQIAKLAEKQPDGGLTEEGIGKNPDFKDSINAIKKHINKV